MHLTRKVWTYLKFGSVSYVHRTNQNSLKEVYLFYIILNQSDEDTQCKKSSISDHITTKY